MNLKKIIKKIRKEDKSAKIKIRNFELGYWINPLNNQWIIKRVYIKSDKDLSDIKLLISKINQKTLKHNIQLVLQSDPIIIESN